MLSSYKCSHLYFQSQAAENIGGTGGGLEPVTAPIITSATEWFLQPIDRAISQYFIKHVGRAPLDNSCTRHIFNLRCRTTEKPLTLRYTRGGTYNEPADGYNTVFTHVSIGGSIDRSRGVRRNHLASRSKRCWLARRLLLSTSLSALASVTAGSTKFRSCTHALLAHTIIVSCHNEHAGVHSSDR